MSHASILMSFNVRGLACGDFNIDQSTRSRLLDIVNLNIFNNPYLFDNVRF